MWPLSMEQESIALSLNSAERTAKRISLADFDPEAHP
jgi:hypothetical protein